MKAFWILTAFFLVGACATQSHKERMQSIKDNIELIDNEKVVEYALTITENELKTHLYLFASDAFQGRATGTAGQKLSAEFLERYYRSEGISSPLPDDNYFQPIPGSYFGKDYNDSENVLAYIEGEESADEVVVISAHFDHEGINKNGDIYYGADDDGSGTVALMEMAQAFKKAKEEGHGPRRSILFLHTTAEEIGLYGSRYYTENPVFPLEKTVANLNIDMIGRKDYNYEDKDIDYIYIIGSDRLSNELHFLNEAVNDTYFDLELNYRYNAIDDKKRYFYRSDHYNFAKNKIPVIFYFNGEHEDYSRVTDTPDKIDYDLLTKRTRLIFATAWQLANQENRPKLDKSR